MKYIGVVGSRRRDSQVDKIKVESKILELYEPGDILVSGGCPKGADHFAEEIAKEYGMPILIFYPNWSAEGRRAGLARNTHIAKRSHVLIACVASDRTGGTEDTIAKWRQGRNECHLHFV